MSCAVQRDNVIFALTHHGGHLGYFEGGLVLPNSVTWLDRVIVEFSSALLRRKPTTTQQQCQAYAADNLHPNCEPSAKKSPSADDKSDNSMASDLLQTKHSVERSASPSKASCKVDKMDQLAARVVADILRVSASVVYSDAEDASQNAALVGNCDVATGRSVNINPLSK